jgi:hypothetical protein
VVVTIIILRQIGLSTSWYNFGDLGLSGSLAVEWECYRKALNSSGVSIMDGDDTLMWTGGDHSGYLSAKNVYLAILSTQDCLVIDGWRRGIWKWTIQLKIKLFTWLAIEGKIHTWDTLQRKGWEGP